MADSMSEKTAAERAEYNRQEVAAWVERDRQVALALAEYERRAAAEGRDDE